MRANMPRTGDRHVNKKPFRIAINLRESARFYPLDLQKIAKNKSKRQFDCIETTAGPSQPDCQPDQPRYPSPHSVPILATIHTAHSRRANPTAWDPNNPVLWGHALLPHSRRANPTAWDPNNPVPWGHTLLPRSRRANPAARDRIILYLGATRSCPVADAQTLRRGTE